MAPQTTNTPTALTANAFTRSGFTFNNWNTLAVGGGIAYSNNASYPFSTSVTLYAQWTAVPSGGGGGGFVFTDPTPTPTPVPTPTPTPTPVPTPTPTPTPTPVPTPTPEPTPVVPTPVVPTLITVANPLTLAIAASEAKSVAVNVEGTGGTLIPITVDIPVGTTGVDGTVRLTPVTTPDQNSAGVITIKVEIIDAFGAVIPQLNAPITIRFNNSLGETIVAQSSDGYLWEPIPLIANGGTTLGATDKDGYYLDANGKVVIVTNHLTLFGFKVFQSGTMKVSSSGNAYVKTLTTKLYTSGGSGSGSLTYQTSTSNICSVANNGVVTFKIAGVCSVSAIKGGDDTYMHQQSMVSQLTIKNYELSAVGASLKKHVTVILGTAYANKTAVISYAPKGSKTYVFVASLKLSDIGKVTSKRNVPNGSTLRIQVAGKTVATKVLQA
jgi:hypothetical protein